MKSITRYLIPAAILAALPALGAAESVPTEKKDLRTLAPSDMPPPHRMHRVMRREGPREKEIVTFLGIESQPADSALAAQLNLMKGTGLVVREIVPDSPASAVLKPNDVLVRLDDQILIAQRQLAVLIRNHKEGDEVTLTFIRGGKENTARVKLTKHEVPKMAMFAPFPPNEMFTVPFNDDDVMERDDMDRVLSLMDRHGPNREPRRMHFNRPVPPPGMRSTSVNMENSNMVFTDDAGSLDLTIKGGAKTLVAKDPTGKEIFAGPVTTPDDRRSMPSDLRERLEKLEGMQEFSFQTDEDFQGGDVGIVQPRRTKIGTAMRPVRPSDPLNPF